MAQLSDSELNILADKGYLVMDSWIDAETIAICLEEMEEVQKAGQFKKAQVTHDGFDKIVRSDWTFWLTEPMPGRTGQIYRILKSWMIHFNQNLFCSITNIEAHWALYPPGPGYEKHLDQPYGRGQRRITFVLYLNPGWREEDGGHLVLYDLKNTFLTKISPQAGRLILFRSELFPHEVLPSQKLRRSLTGWFRNDAL